MTDARVSNNINDFFSGIHKRSLLFAPLNQIKSAKNEFFATNELTHNSNQSIFFCGYQHKKGIIF